MTTRLYRFTHRTIDLIEDDGAIASNNDTVPNEVSLSYLTMFSTILFFSEFQKMGLGDQVDVSETCNMSEWYRRLYSGSGSPQPASEDKGDEEDVDVLTLPPKPTSQGGLIYTTTFKPSSDSNESFSSFLFAYHKPIPKTAPPSATFQELPQDIQDQIAQNGVTHIWLCGSDPERRRGQLMSRCLKRLEKDVLEWKTSGQGSGVLTVHTIPQAFPGMVQFLVKNGFMGGDKAIDGESGKVFYWKVV